MRRKKVSSSKARCANLPSMMAGALLRKEEGRRERVTAAEQIYRHEERSFRSLPYYLGRSSIFRDSAVLSARLSSSLLRFPGIRAVLLIYLLGRSFRFFLLWGFFVLDQLYSLKVLDQLYSVARCDKPI
ncbi:hypothetical protein KFK09_014096 [Dendrobium nobile]|uniref:Uncharacterized protein n=1 Tax=Dendrobium nobile TaxID=94219 RepID=A0A8T3BC06_DENNO|nr:hypothetical protein KFK09_014096 [Dendrobium nobile]